MLENCKTKILIADDEKPLAKALMLKLTQEGFSVDVVHNGKQALKILKKKKYDVLLLDLIMPELDGFGVLEKLTKKDKKNLSIYILSNLGQQEDIEKASNYGVTDYVVKSNTTLAEIVNMIENKHAYTEKEEY